VFPALSFTVDTTDVVSFHPTTTTFKSPAVCAAGNVTGTVAVDDCGVADATWLNPITTDPVYVYPLARLPLSPLLFVTVTVAAPVAPAGVVAVIDVALTTVTPVADPVPNFTVAPAAKFVPVIVTAVPPATGPLFGVTPVTVGGTAYVNPLVRLPLCPLTVTVTVTAPAVPAGVVAVIDVALTTVTFVAAVVPNFTVAPAAKFVPVIVTAVPPATGPLFGVTPVTVGVTAYVYPFARLPLREPGFVTVTVTAPAAPAGVVAVIVVLLTTVTPVAAALPNVTVAPATKFVPVIVTAVPPVTDPLFGDTPVTVGVTAYVYPFARLPLTEPGFVTVTVTAPAAPAGVVAVIVVLFTTVTPVAAALPNVTVAPAAKFVPVIVTAVPPAGVPLLGETLLTVGGVT
jgi:hypothetical protein